MPMSIRNAAIVTAICGLAAPAQAAGPPPPDAAAFLQAFNDTCRRGFPDLDTIAANALAHGWQASAVRFISGPPALAKALPRVLRKDGMMLILIGPGLPGKFREVCTVSSSSPTQLTGADVAAVVGPDLNAGTSTIEKDRGTDAQVWTVAPGITVEAGVTIDRKARAISISARRAP